MVRVDKTVLAMSRGDAMAVALLVGSLPGLVITVGLAALGVPTPLAVAPLIVAVPVCYIRARVLAVCVHGDGRVTARTLLGRVLTIVDPELPERPEITSRRLVPLGRMAVLAVQQSGRPRRATRLLCTYSTSREQRRRWLGLLTSQRARSTSRAEQYVHNGWI